MLQIAQLQAELAGNRRTGERLERAKQDLEDQLNQLTVQLMSERKELRSLQLENVRLENELNEASQRLEDQADKSRRNESDLQREVNKLIDTLRDEKELVNPEWSTRYTVTFLLSELRLSP